VSELLDATLAFHVAGCCAVPVRPDGTKAPAAFWKEYQTRRPTEEQLRDWFTSGGYDGLGIICGAVSDNLEMLEFEGRAMAEGHWKRFMDALGDHGMAELGDRIAGGYAEASPSGGLHLLVRVKGQARRNTKLARRPSTPDELAAWKRQQQADIDREKNEAVRARRQETLDRVTRGEQVPQVLVETRGEGGFVVTAPSAGRTHETGKPWKLLSGGPDTIAVITEDERDALYAIASLLDEMPASDVPPNTQHSGAPAAESDEQVLRPGDDYNRRTDWADILTPHGWTHVANFGQGRAWRRPGKNRGISATTGRNDGDNLYVFSSSTEFETERPYSKFGALALLEYGGDHAAAARALRAQGYGGEMPHSDDGIEDLIADPPAGGSGSHDGHDGKTSEHGDDEPAAERRSINITEEPAAITGITDALNARALPSTYVRSGHVVEITTPSGGVDDLVAVTDVTSDRLRRLLARHTDTYKIKATRETSFAVAASPSVSTCAAVLTDQHWPGLQPLHGLIHAPVIRPDGTVLQTPGYDETTGLYLAPQIPVPSVPDDPTRHDIAAARRFLLDHVLGDFCFDSAASRANYVALLMTPMLRLYMGGLVPFGVISATTRGSGKTYLTSVMNAVYGCHMTTWQRDDVETKKVLTAVLKDTTQPVVVFDNVDIHETVDHPALAMLLTSRTWSGRILGESTSFHGLNDRLWIATGNNLAVGGDISSRSVLVRLDPQMERPELRTDFEIDDLDGWLHDDTNRGELLRAVLTLARAWIAAGAPRIKRAMRNFTAWAQAMGGLVEFLDLPDFLGNETQLVDGSDEEETSTAAFLAQWASIFGAQPQRAVDLLNSAQGETVMGQWHDRWQGTFPSRAGGKPYSAKGMGRFLASRRDRIFGGIKLIGEMEPRTKVWLYRVERVAAEAGAREAA
jgi:hypothetical protein